MWLLLCLRLPKAKDLSLRVINFFEAFPKKKSFTCCLKSLGKGSVTIIEVIVYT